MSEDVIYILFIVSLFGVAFGLFFIMTGPLKEAHCDHESDEGQLVNAGMNKVFHCTKCGRFLGIV